MSEIVDAEALAYRTPSWLGSKPGLCWVDSHGNVIHTDDCTGHGWDAA